MFFPRIIELNPLTKLYVSNCPWQICGIVYTRTRFFNIFNIFNISEVKKTVNVLLLVFSGIYVV